MIKISCYQTTQNQLSRTFCQLAEKCYYSDLKTNVFTTNQDYSQSLDGVLWTYSKKNFIPHATNTDPLPEKQPIYITHNIEEYNQAEIIIFINATKPIILETISKQSKIRPQNLQKILFLFDEVQKIQSSEINTLLDKSYIKDFEINSFLQTKQGSWQKTTIL